MPDVYCGIGKVPKKSRMGSMKECAEKGQIRYYGIKKIDTRVLETAKQSSSMPKRDAVIKKVALYKGKVKKLRDNVEYEKDKKKLKTFKADLEKAEKELKEYNKLFSQIEKARDKKQTKKKGTKK
jgi:hypothetical protein